MFFVCANLFLSLSLRSLVGRSFSLSHGSLVGRSLSLSCRSFVGITMVFVPAITAFTVPTLIGNGNFTLYGNEIELAFKTLSGQGDYAVGSTLSLILLVCVLLSTAVMNRFDKNQKEGGQMW